MSHSRGHRALTTPPRIIETPAIPEERDDEIDNEVILRPRQLQSATSHDDLPAKLVNKNLKNLHLDAPYFTQRPASENDIFTISTPTKPSNGSSITDELTRFSMTPEVPSISFSQLPKNYLETPSIDKYKRETPSLQEIQTAEIRLSKASEDYSMPRYYGKSDIILNRSFDPIGSNSSIASGGSSASLPRRHPERSKRLKNFRMHLPPLMIHSNTKSEKDK